MSQENKKYRVCIVTAILPPAYGGAEVAAFKYATRLNSNPDSKAIVIGWDRNGAYQKSGVNYDFVYSVQFPENTKDAKGIFVYFQQYQHIWNCFIALMKPMWKHRKEYDYIHNFNSGFAFNRVSIFIGKLLGKKVITETSLVGDDDPLSLGRFISWKDYFKPKFLRYVFYRMADSYVSKSNVITEIFEKSEIPMSRVVEIPYSADITKFKPLNADDKRKMREKLHLWKDGLIILFVGGINIRKGVHLLVDAYISIEKKFPDVKLLIVGPTYKYDKNYISGIQNKIQSLNLNDKIYLTEENVSNVEEYMQCSDIFVLPSRQEGFPISIIEAMSSGLAVVASDIPEISRAQIENGKDGFVFPVGDTGQLALTIEKLIEQKERVSQIGKIARNKALEKWSTETVDHSYRNLYESLTTPFIDSVRKKKKSRRIKILYSISSLSTSEGGRELMNVISGLDKNIYEPEIFCHYKKGDLLKAAEDLNIPVYFSNFSEQNKNDNNELKNLQLLTKFLKAVDPDIIHFYNYPKKFTEILTSRLSGIKWVFTKNNVSWKSHYGKMNRIFPLSVSRNNNINSENYSELIKNFYVPVGINAGDFSGLIRDENLIAKYELADSKPVILTASKITPDKGIEYLIMGFSLVQDDYQHAKLIICGENKSEYGESLKNMVNELGLEDRIIFTGRLDDIKPFLSIADVFIFSPVKASEGISNSVSKAMAAGILSYGSDVPGLRDQLKEFEDQLFEPENPGAIANKIMHAMNMTKEEREVRIMRQREFTIKNYAKENEILGLQNLYSSLIKDDRKI